MTEKQNEILLKVEHLCQYFKMGNGELKAVDDVSFDVKRGEVFGIVGESGCGKTTTGRTIIKLYPTTSGNVYLKGVRICAGTRAQKLELARLRQEQRERIAMCRMTLKEQTVDMDPQAKEAAEQKVRAEIESIKTDTAQKLKALEADIRAARSDHKYCDRKYQVEQMAKVREKFAAPLAEAAGNAQTGEETAVAAYKALKKQYADEMRVARNERLITQIQMIFQDPIASLNPRMTVREIIAEGLIIKGIRDKKYIDEKVYEVLDLVGLVPEHAGRYPHEFSGGQRQRIGIARSIVLNPEMIIADEPISALDVSIQAQVISLLNDLRNKIGLTIIFIAHDLSVVKYFSDRIAVMYYGKIVELTTSDELFAHPMHPYTRSLLSAIPVPDPIYEKQRKRTLYNPITDHDYSQEQPSMREVTPGHYVYCNSEEEQRFLSEIRV